MIALEWLTPGFLQECLGEEVTSVELSAAAPPGNNYGSVVTRVLAKLAGRAEPLSLIVKSEVTSGGAFQELIALIKDTEFDFYYKFLPEVRKFIKTGFFPKCYFSPRPCTILLEDLRDQGFVMAKKAKFLDLEHCSLYMAAAATFHAAALAVHKREPALVEALGREKFVLEDPKTAYISKKMISDCLELFTESTSKIDKYKHVCDIVDIDRDTFWSMMAEALRPSETGLNTLTQGDPWITNMMFRYDAQGGVTDIKLLDFQALRFTSPAADLTFFIWTSANNHVRSNHLQDLFRVYQQSLNAKLEEFGCGERMSLDQLMAEVRRLSPHALITAISAIPINLVETPMDINGMQGTENFYRKYYTDNFREDHLPHILAQLDDLGIFEAFRQCRTKHKV